MTRTVTPTKLLQAIAVALALAVLLLAAPGARAQSSPDQGPGGPVLVVTDPGDPFGTYYAEILRAEGLNEFAVTDTGNLDAATLADYQVVVLAQTAVTDAQTTVAHQLGAGRRQPHRHAPRPPARRPARPGRHDRHGQQRLHQGQHRVVRRRRHHADTMQFHGAADRDAGDRRDHRGDALLDATASTSRPAVTLRSVGSAGGQAAAFTYDLARSIVATRQGNIAWAGQKRDGEINPIRSDDLFFPDWLDFSKVPIPQADEQQRLLANLITQMNLDRTPLPRFWYLPRGEKAAVVLTGDDHGARRHHRAVQSLRAGEPGRLLGRRLAMRAVDLVRLPRHRHHRRPGAGLPGRRLRDRPAPEHRLRRLHARLARGRLGDAAPRVRRRLPQPVRPADQPDALHRLERLGQRAEGRAQPRRPLRRQLLLLARGVGPGPPRHVHRLGLPDALRGCRTAR